LLSAVLLSAFKPFFFFLLSLFWASKAAALSAALLARSLSAPAEGAFSRLPPPPMLGLLLLLPLVELDVLAVDADKEEGGAPPFFWGRWIL
jgi:hypothetical protein